MSDYRLRIDEIKGTEVTAFLELAGYGWNLE
jgi:hypothetical protein